MSKTLNPAQLRAEAATARREADEIEARAAIQAAGLRENAALFEKWADEGLTIAVDSAINRYMTQATNVLDVVRSKRSAGRGRVSDHPFPKALEKANLTMTEAAALLKTHRSTVKSWLTRKIPRDQAEAIAKLIDLPATAKNWPAGIKG